MVNLIEHPGHTHDIGGMNPLSHLSRDDIVEYQSRVVRIQDLMREHGLDGLVISTVPAPGNFHVAPYVRYFTGYETPRRYQAPDLVVIPQSGDVALVLAAGRLRTRVTSARLKSWVPKVVATYGEDIDWEIRTQWALRGTDEVKTDVLRAIREAGLANSRIGLVGVWPKMDETMEQLGAHFESADQLLLDMTCTYSPWEIEKLEHAQRDVDAAIRAFGEVARPGNLYREAVAEAVSVCMKGGSDLLPVLGVCSPGGPWMFGVFGLQEADARFQEGDMINLEWVNNYQGYGIQCTRSWVLGKPTKNQIHVMETAKFAFESMREQFKPGVTGSEMWDLSTEICTRENLDQFARSGHVQGLRSYDERFDFQPPAKTPIREGQVFVIHPMPIDKSDMSSANVGDTVVVTKGGNRLLASTPRD